MNYLLTNICLDQKLKVSLKDKFNVIFFNPWGFSKKGVQHQLYETVSFLDIQIESQVFYYIKPLFWGKRAQIGFEALKNLYPKNFLVFLNEDQFNKLLGIHESNKL